MQFFLTLQIRMTQIFISNNMKLMQKIYGISLNT